MNSVLIVLTWQKVWASPDLQGCWTSWWWWAACTTSPSAGTRTGQSPSRQRCVDERRTASTLGMRPEVLRYELWTSRQTVATTEPCRSSCILKLPVKPGEKISKLDKERKPNLRLPRMHVTSSSSIPYYSIVRLISKKYLEQNHCSTIKALTLVTVIYWK